MLVYILAAHLIIQSEEYVKKQYSYDLLVILAKGSYIKSLPAPV